MSDELATLDSNIMRLRLQDLKKILQQCLPQDIFFFSMLTEQEKTVPVVSFM
jgi:hypothetical protein